ncbi:MAG: lysostaphin resistance A-like protein [Planctomycetia bacterium]
MEIEVSDAALEFGAVPPAVWAVLACGFGASLCVAWLVVRRMRLGMEPVPWRPRPAASWNGADVAAAVVGFLVLQVLAAGSLPPDAGPRMQLAAGSVAMLLFSAGAMLGLVSRGADWAVFGWRQERLAADTGLAIAGLLLLLAPLLGLAAVLDRVVPYSHPLVDVLAETRDAASIGLVVFAAVVAAPIAEELLFRRLLQGWLESRLEPAGPRTGGVMAVVLSSLAFAAAHTGQGLAWVPLFFFGLVVGYLARQTGSIVPGIILHGLFNAVSVGMVVLQTS